MKIDYGYLVITSGLLLFLVSTLWLIKTSLFHEKVSLSLFLRYCKNEYGNRRNPIWFIPNFLFLAAIIGVNHLQQQEMISVFWLSLLLLVPELFADKLNKIKILNILLISIFILLFNKAPWFLLASYLIFFFANLKNKHGFSYLINVGVLSAYLNAISSSLGPGDLTLNGKVVLSSIFIPMGYFLFSIISRNLPDIKISRLENISWVIIIAGLMIEGALK